MTRQAIEQPVTPDESVIHVALDYGRGQHGVWAQIESWNGALKHKDRVNLTAATARARYSSAVHKALPEVSIEVCDRSLLDLETKISRHLGEAEEARERGGEFGPTQAGAMPADQNEPRIYLTDVGNAQRLIRAHGQDMRWCDGLGGWHIWDGGRWAADDTFAAMRFAKDTTRAMLKEAANMADDDAMSALGKHAIKSQADGRLNAMLNQARSEPGVAVGAATFDADPWLLNVKNGTIDLRTGACRAAARADLLTKRAQVTYDPAATCPTFRRFISEVMGGRTDLVTFMQRALGYSLVGETREHVVLIMHGGGDNGKSTLVELLLALLGDYAHGIPSDALMVRKGDDGPKSEIAALRATRFVAASESEEGKRFNEAFVKQLTGSDTVTVRFLYGKWFEMRPEFTVWLSTNHRPVIRNTDHGIWRRIRLIPFDVKFLEPPTDDADRRPGVPYKDKSMPAKLRAELPGILNWLIEGCLDWQRAGLPTPQDVRDATETYRAEMDKRGAFLDEVCVYGSKLRAPFGDLYAAYCAWCDANNEHKDTGRAFGQYLDERGFASFKSGAVRYRLGLSFRPAPTPDDPFPTSTSSHDMDQFGTLGRIWTQNPLKSPREEKTGKVSGNCVPMRPNVPNVPNEMCAIEDDAVNTCLWCGSPSPGGVCCPTCKQ